ncbi:amidase family protein [Mesorhizobium sp. J428]|uniref:amidase family protein n=1 Tax=Mesorhizobium sp. J428 TaxID=2898440 RepID=UPI00215132A2|nr:amidase family protein [Mesorhizobium sp. J428]MCR5857474.1 hypothetical protein [Mesorhizobium sp. J428]
MLAGLRPASRGDIVVDGQRVTHPISKVGMVFQAAVLLKWRSVLENVLLPAELAGLNPARYRDRARELLKLVGLGGFEAKRPGELSGGMARLCAEFGHIVEEAAPEFDLAAARGAFATAFQANTTANVGRATGGRFPEPGLVEPLTRAIAERGMAISAPDYIRALQAMHRESRRIAGFFTGYDVWLTPTLGMLPPKVGAYGAGVTDVDLWLAQLMEFLPFTWIFNVIGQPAMSVPTAMSPEGLPVGTHFAGRVRRGEHPLRPGRPDRARTAMAAN